jgi:hypothetical protein
LLSIPTRALLNDVVTLRKREFANALFSALQSCGRCIGLAIAAFPVEELPLIDTFRTHLRASFVLAVVFILSLNLSAVFFVNEPCARGQIPVAGVLEDGDEMNDERKNESGASKRIGVGIVGQLKRMLNSKKSIKMLFVLEVQGIIDSFTY